MGNSVFFPQVDPRRFLDTSDRANLLKIRSYSLTAFFSTVTSSRGSYRYFDRTTVDRRPAARNGGR
jgi:hypothetical protein